MSLFLDANMSIIFKYLGVPNKLPTYVHQVLKHNSLSSLLGTTTFVFVQRQLRLNFDLEKGNFQMALFGNTWFKYSELIYSKTLQLYCVKNEFDQTNQFQNFSLSTVTETEHFKLTNFEKPCF